MEIRAVLASVVEMGLGCNWWSVVVVSRLIEIRCALLAGAPRREESERHAGGRVGRSQGQASCAGRPDGKTSRARVEDDSTPHIGQGARPFGAILRVLAAVAFLFAAGSTTTASAGRVSLSAVYWDSGHQRWRDAATTPYDEVEIAGYDYETATVVFDHLEQGPTIRGTLTGSNLKPNFAYQVKLNGKPTYFWGSEGDDLANERIGFAGRWWVSRVDLETGAVVDGWNSNDAEYLDWKLRDFTDGVYAYVYEGYLLFAYVVTDEEGRFQEELALDSSFHVLWKLAQRLPGPNDSTPSVHRFVVNEASDWYASSQPDAVRSLYAEWESTRALPGELSLPAGSYAVRLFLTEESFHESADSPSSGSWATVMTHDDLRFVIVAPPVPALSPLGLALLLVSLLATTPSIAWSARSDAADRVGRRRPGIRRESGRACASHQAAPSRTPAPTPNE
jgi:hypothetical protein